MPTSPYTARMISVAHGFAMRDLDRAARVAVVLDRWDSGDASDRYDAVLYAITEHLLTTDERPTARDLVRIGLRSPNRYVAQEMHHLAAETGYSAGALCNLLAGKHRPVRPERAAA